MIVDDSLNSCVRQRLAVWNTFYTHLLVDLQGRKDKNYIIKSNERGLKPETCWQGFGEYHGNGWASCVNSLLNTLTFPCQFVELY